MVVSISPALNAQIGTCFRPLLRLWPDVRTIAADLGISYFTVAAWMRRDSVPTWHWDALIASARRRRIRGVTFVTLRARSAQRLALDNTSYEHRSAPLLPPVEPENTRSKPIRSDAVIAHDAQADVRAAPSPSIRKQTHAA
jgi:hypothetical protein